MTDTLIADADGVYHPGLFNDRLLLGMKGTMSEAELHILRARLDGGIRNKAARGELRRGLPVGLVWGEADGEIRLASRRGRHRRHRRGLRAVRGVRVGARGVAVAARPGAEVPAADRRLPARARRDHLGRADLPCGAQRADPSRLRGRLRVRQDPPAAQRRRGRPELRTTVKLPQGEWEVLITDHHRGFIDWDTYQANQARIGANTRPRAHEPGTGAVREGCALLQGLATCGTCGRKLAVYYDGPAKSTPGYYCTGTGQLVEGRGTRHLRVGGLAIDAAVAEAFLAALQPAALQACLAAAQQLEDGHDAALASRRRPGRAGPLPGRHAERRYRAVDPDNRLVARGLETEWNTALQQLADAEAELARREAARPKTLTPQEKQADPGSRRRPRRSVVGADHHRQGPQTAAAHPAGRGQHQRAPRPRPNAAPIWCCAGKAARSPN